MSGGAATSSGVADRLAGAARRVAGQWTHRLRSLPILALEVHSACNCRCVMCDIWRANAHKREIDPVTLAQHLDAIVRLRVQRVMLTGGEPLLNQNLWTLTAALRERHIRVTLVTTGLLVEPHAASIAATCDHVVVSLDGPPEVHDTIRRVSGGFDRLAGGVRALAGAHPRPRLTARMVVQAGNAHVIPEAIAAARKAGFDELSFLPVDVWSSAFNRPGGVGEERRGALTVSASELDALARTIDGLASSPDLTGGFVVGGLASLRRLHTYFAANAGVASYPRVTCNAPWVSAVLEAGGALRPCFFHRPYSGTCTDLAAGINSKEAIAFRRGLDVATNATCQRCVCSLWLGAMDS
jgi:MoaA/NifB/PqqE/SkfB family radical SAM enzyme